jgi:hypothetical protein
MPGLTAWSKYYGAMLVGEMEIHINQLDLTRRREKSRERMKSAIHSTPAEAGDLHCAPADHLSHCFTLPADSAED